MSAYQLTQGTGIDAISRRDFGVVAGAAGLSLMVATADGRPGWAHTFVRAGYKVVLPDWPGVGRSGYIPLDKLPGEVVGKVLASLDQPAIIMTHSMSGAYGWKLLETYGERIAKVVAVAPGPPGNIQAVSEIVSETDDTVVVRSSVTLAINLKQLVVSDRNFVEVKLVDKSTQFPRQQIGLYASSLVPIRRGCCMSAGMSVAASSRSPMCPSFAASAFW